MRRLTVLLAVLGGLTAALAVPSGAAASCIAPPPLPEAIEQAQVVFVGTVVDLTNNDRTAAFKVDEIWKGEVDAMVTVVGGAVGPNVASSVDRTYVLGTRYLVFPHPASGRLTDSSCSLTQPYTDDLAAFRPDDARPPDLPAEPVATPERAAGLPVTSGPDGAPGGTPPWQAIALAAAAALLVAATVWAFSRPASVERRAPPPG